MITFLGDVSVKSSVLQVPAFWFFLILILASLIYFAYINYRQYKFKLGCKLVQQNLKVGDKVKTFSGLLGEVVNITESDELKIVTLKNLDKTGICVTVDIQAICALLNQEQNEEKKD